MRHSTDTKNVYTDRISPLDQQNIVGDAMEKTLLTMSISGGSNATLYALSAPNKIKYFWANNVTNYGGTNETINWKDGGEAKQLKVEKGIAALVNEWINLGVFWIVEKSGSSELRVDRYILASPIQRLLDLN